MGHKRSRRSFETPRKRAAPQDDGGVWVYESGARHDTSLSSGALMQRDQ
jgi:hypothetical protein